MPLKKRKKFIKMPKSKQKLVVMASILVVLTIPLVLWGIFSLESADIRSKAEQELFKSDLKCKISFPYIDPSSVMLGKNATVQVSGDVSDIETGETEVSESVQEITIYALESAPVGADIERQIFSKSYKVEDKVEVVSEQFLYKPENLGEYTISGLLKTVDQNGVEGSHLCLLERKPLSYPSTELGEVSRPGIAQVVANNVPPEFTTALPATALNDIKVGDLYNHTVGAKDIDNEIQYDAAFTPGASWLKMTSNKPDKNTVEIKFSGTAETAGSYLASILIWDGWNGHTLSQSWIINVNPKENDIPKVTVLKPVKGTKVKQGEEVTIEWKAEDLNHIETYDVFLSKTPGDKGTWIKLQQLGYNYTSLVYNTASLSTGTYTAIVQATDNQSPAAVGVGMSEVFEVGSVTSIDPTTTPDDGPQISKARIINIYPGEMAVVNTLKPTVKATLVPAEKAQVMKNSIKMTLNDGDVTSKLTTKKVGTTSQLEINYTPDKNLEKDRKNKVVVSFQDSANNKVSREWVFTVEQKTDDTSIIKIFGKEYTKKSLLTAVLILIGIIILAILIPWLIYVAMKGGDKDSYSSYASYTPVKSYSSPTSDTSYTNFNTGITPTYTPTYQPDEPEPQKEDEKVPEPEPVYSSTVYDPDGSYTTPPTDDYSVPTYTPTYIPSDDTTAISTSADDSTSATTTTTTTTSDDGEVSATTTSSDTSDQPEKTNGDYSYYTSGSTDSTAEDTYTPEEDEDELSNGEVQSVTELAKQLEEEYQSSNTKSSPSEERDQKDSNSSGSEDFSAPPPTIVE